MGTQMKFSEYLLLVVTIIVLPSLALDYSGKVLLVSMDGFRWDYVSKVPGLANFVRLGNSGWKVDYVANCFVTVTFPSHYTIVTGLYAESHGVVANNMFDSDTNSTFTLTSSGSTLTYPKDSLWWADAEPIWVTAVKNGLKAGTLFWPGCDVEIRGHRPTAWYSYSDNMTYAERVKTAVRWLNDEGMDFVALYFDEPDTTGHKYGPFARETNAKIVEMDGVLGQLLDALNAAGLSDVVNVIVTSDHGMTSVDVNKRMISLYDVVNRSFVQRVPDSGPVTAILPADGREDDVVAALSKVAHVTVYRKKELPDDYHYKDHRRIMPIIVIADSGWLLVEDPQAFLDWGAKGDHGYDNALPDMKPIFFATGPNFAKGVYSRATKSVNIYPLLCELLGLEPNPHNGTLETKFLIKFTNSGHSVIGSPCLWIACVMSFGVITLSFFNV